MALKYDSCPTPCPTIELKDLNQHTLLERSDQLKHWTKHFTQLYCTEVPFKGKVLDSFNQIPVADHLNKQPNLSEVILAKGVLK